MKTIETAPANITARDLAKALTKPATPPKTEVRQDAGRTTETATESTEASRERPNDEPEPADLSQTEAEVLATENTESAETTEVQTDGQTEATETEVQPEATQATETEAEPVKAELPEELKDAMDIAKADGKKGVAELLKRVHKLTDARDTERNARLAADEQLKQLRAELQEAKKGGGEVRQDAGRTMHPEVAQIAGEIQAADNWLNWCDANATGGEVPDGKGGTVALDDKGVNALRRQLERDRQDLVAHKAVKEREVRDAFHAQYQTSHAQAVKDYPWLTKADAPEHQEMQAILKAVPGFKADPEWELKLGDFITGRRMREARAKARTTAPVARKAPPSREPTKVVTTPPGGGARQVKGDEEVDAAEAQFKKSGKTADFAKWQSAKARQRRTVK